MEIDLKIMKDEERKYSYAQSSQIEAMTGYIGRLRGDFDTGGELFCSTWEDGFKGKDFDIFDKEFNEVINCLRFDEKYKGLLKNRSGLSDYCWKNEKARFASDGDYYGFRADTKNYSYLLRLNPKRGEYNFYVYCFKKEYLDRHINEAKKGIRFITPEYKELFRIKDGERITITDEYGKKSERTCKYIDDYHTEVGSNIFHICEFAERAKENNWKVEPADDKIKDEPVRNEHMKSRGGGNER